MKVSHGRVTSLVSFLARFFGATFLLVSFSLPQVAKAQEINSFFRGIRALGMGGAAVATVNDQTSLFYNPAGLGKIRGPYLVPINAEAEINTELSSALSTS